ncbi:MAG: tol-pal system protein YbgF [Candidatus Berkiella sp.]
MPLTRAKKAPVKAFLVMLSLCYAGVACAIASVESRSQGGAPSYANQNADDAGQNNALNLLQRIEYLQREMQELRGKVEEQAYLMQQMQEQNKKLYLDLDKRVGATNAAVHVPNQDMGTTSNAQPQALELNTPSQFVSDVPEQGSVNAQAMPVNDEKAYQAAYRLVQNRDFDGAIKAFNNMLSQAPTGKYAPNAQYWLGEIYLTKGELDKASESFNMVYNQYPKHPKAADSLLKLGYVEYNKGQFKRCTELLNQVKNQFPGTTSAQLADSRLQRMQQEGKI